MADHTDNENAIPSNPNDRPEDAPKKDAEKPTESNTDVEGGNGPVSTTA